MKISIITPSFNSIKTIAQTIESVISQDYLDLEYIIIDGGSLDGTIEIVQKYQQQFPIILVSEKDQGLYDAMNKGLALASGEIIGILNSDDLYFDNQVLSKVAKAFAKNSDTSAVYGDLVYFKNNDFQKTIRHWSAGSYRPKKLSSGWIIPHPVLFVKKEFYTNHPQWFNLQFKIAGDYEMILRFLLIYKMSVYYLPEVLVRMRAGGLSGRSPRQRMRGWRELKLAWKINQLKKPAFFIWRRVLAKLPQFFSGLDN
jgi:glycosyltransferase involved in cell wall biosynthesis